MTFFLSMLRLRGSLRVYQSDELLLKVKVMTKLSMGIVPYTFATEQCNVLHALLSSQAAPRMPSTALQHQSSVPALQQYCSHPIGQA